MDLREYLFRKKLSVQEFAEKVGCTPQTISHVVHGKSLSFKMAQRISMATDLEVGILDMLPNTYLFCVAEFRRRQKQK